MPPSKKSRVSRPVRGEAQIFANLAIEIEGMKFAASGTEDYINRQKRWFLEEFDVRRQEEEPGSDPDAG